MLLIDALRILLRTDLTFDCLCPLVHRVFRGKLRLSRRLDLILKFHCRAILEALFIIAAHDDTRFELAMLITRIAAQLLDVDSNS